MVLHRLAVGGGEVLVSGSVGLGGWFPVVLHPGGCGGCWALGSWLRLGVRLAAGGGWVAGCGDGGDVGGCVDAGLVAAGRWSGCCGWG